MTDRERLVMEALKQVKAWEIHENFLLSRIRKHQHNGEPVSEELAEELTHTQKVLEHRRGMHRRLQALFDLDRAEADVEP